MNFRKPDRKQIEREQQTVSVDEAGRIARNAYLRDWRANNRDKVKQYNSDYWARKASREVSNV